MERIHPNGATNGGIQGTRQPAQMIVLEHSQLQLHWPLGLWAPNNTFSNPVHVYIIMDNTDINYIVIDIQI